MLDVSEQYGVIRDLDARAWDGLVNARGGHLLQTSAWGELKARFGWRVARVALESNGALIAGAQMLVRDLPLGWRFAYVPRGPVVNPNDTPALGALIAELGAMARAQGAFALKIEPNAPSPLPLPYEGKEIRASRPIQPQTTIHVDLTHDCDAMLAAMKSKWRYNIRLAERKGVTVRAGDVSDVDTFYRLLEITSVRDRFAIHASAYYRAAIELLSAGDGARLFIAEYEGTPLAAIFVTAVGEEAIYLYGASSNAHRDKMPNHALHWRAMQWAKARGCARYDLWGIAETAWADVGTTFESSFQHGLYRFKQGFGGAIVRYAGACDFVFARGKYWLYQRAVGLRRASF